MGGIEWKGLGGRPHGSRGLGSAAAAALFIGLVTLGAGCGGGAGEADTGTLLRIEADPDLAPRVQRLRLEVRRAGREDAPREYSTSGDPALRFPLQRALTAPPGQPAASLWVRARGYGDGEAPLVESLAETAFVPGSWRLLVLRLQRACAAGERAEPCPEGQRCVDGTCVAAARRAEDLPEIPRDGETDAGAEACESNDDCGSEDPQCTVAICHRGRCLYDPTAREGAGCDDGFACNGADRCAGGRCSGLGIACAPGTRCDERTGRCRVPCEQEADCDDGDPCTRSRCVRGFCTDPAPVTEQLACGDPEVRRGECVRLAGTCGTVGEQEVTTTPRVCVRGTCVVGRPMTSTEPCTAEPAPAGATCTSADGRSGTCDGLGSCVISE